MNWIYAVNATRLLVLIIIFSPDFSKAILHKDFRMRFSKFWFRSFFIEISSFPYKTGKFSWRSSKTFSPPFFLPAAPCYNAGGKPLPAFPNILSGGFLWIPLPWKWPPWFWWFWITSAAILTERRYGWTGSEGWAIPCFCSAWFRAQIFFLFLLPGPYVPSVLACKFRVLIFPADCLSAPKCRSAKSFLTDRQSRAIISP